MGYFSSFHVGECATACPPIFLPFIMSVTISIQPSFMPLYLSFIVSLSYYMFLYRLQLSQQQSKRYAYCPSILQILFIHNNFRTPSNICRKVTLFLMIFFVKKLISCAQNQFFYHYFKKKKGTKQIREAKKQFLNLTFIRQLIDTESQ